MFVSNDPNVVIVTRLSARVGIYHIEVHGYPVNGQGYPIHLLIFLSVLRKIG